MNTTLLLDKAAKEVERAKTQVAADAKAAQLAWQVARAAKIKLKHARKLSRMAKKSARKAEDKFDESSEALESALAKLEKLQKRIRKEQRKNKPAQLVRPSKLVKKAPTKPKPARSNGGLPHTQPKPEPVKTTVAATLPESPVQSPQTTKPAALGAPITRQPAPKTVIGKPAKPAPAVAPEPKSVPAAGRKPGNLNPLPAHGVDVPSSSGKEPMND
jgi:hypothetical protein